jgi:hypothetical protein
VGFCNIKIYQRRNNPTYNLKFDYSLLTERAQARGAVHRATFGTVQYLTTLLFGRMPPEIVTRVLQALERRLPWGTNSLISSYSPEVLISAQRPV